MTDTTCSFGQQLVNCKRPALFDTALQRTLCQRHVVMARAMRANPELFEHIRPLASA